MPYENGAEAKLHFRYTSQAWEVLVMIALIIPGWLVVYLISSFCSALWLIIPLLSRALLGPYVLMRFRPAWFSFKGSAKIQETGIAFHLKFRSYSFMWDDITLFRYLALKTMDTGTHRGLRIGTNTIKGLVIYPVDQSLDAVYFAMMQTGKVSLK